MPSPNQVDPIKFSRLIKDTYLGRSVHETSLINATIPGTNRKVGDITGNGIISFLDAHIVSIINDVGFESTDHRRRYEESCMYIVSLLDYVATGSSSHLTSSQFGGYDLTMLLKDLDTQRIHKALVSVANGETNYTPHIGYRGPYAQEARILTNKFWSDGWGHEIGNLYYTTNSAPQYYQDASNIQAWLDPVATTQTWNAYKLAAIRAHKSYHHVQSNSEYKLNASILFPQNIIMNSDAVKTFNITKDSSKHYFNNTITEKFSTQYQYLKRDPAGSFVAGGIARCPVFAGQSSDGYIPDNKDAGGAMALRSGAFGVSSATSNTRVEHVINPSTQNASSSILFKSINYQEMKIDDNKWCYGNYLKGLYGNYALFSHQSTINEDVYVDGSKIGSVNSALSDTFFLDDNSYVSRFARDRRPVTILNEDPLDPSRSLIVLIYNPLLSVTAYKNNGVYTNTFLKGAHHVFNVSLSFLDQTFSNPDLGVFYNRFRDYYIAGMSNNLKPTARIEIGLLDVNYGDTYILGDQAIYSGGSPTSYLGISPSSFMITSEPTTFDVRETV